MGKTRSSAFVFAAAYIALVVGLFLALGGAAYAQSPSSASDQYDTKVKGVKVSATAGSNTATAAAEAVAAGELRRLVPHLLDPAAMFPVELAGHERVELAGLHAVVAGHAAPLVERDGAGEMAFLAFAV